MDQGDEQITQGGYNLWNMSGAQAEAVFANALPHQKTSPAVSRPMKYFRSPAFSHQPKHLLVPKTRSIFCPLGKSQNWRVLVRRGRFLVRQAGLAASLECHRLR